MWRNIHEVTPILDPNGAILEHSPAADYDVPPEELNRSGAGPFCAFRVVQNHGPSGIFAIAVDNSCVYIGKSSNPIVKRISDIGNISLSSIRKKGGQPSQCRLNHLILEALKNGSSVTFWHCAPPNRHYPPQKEKLILPDPGERPEWNQRKPPDYGQCA